VAIGEKICFAVEAVEFGRCEGVIVAMIITGVRGSNNLVGLSAKGLNGALQGLS